MPSPHYFVTSTPKATPYSPPGHATRGFPAYDVSRRTTVFVKDSWRVELPDIQPEGLTYQTLKDASVRNIPDCLKSRDVSTVQYHATKTHIYAVENWACHSDAHFIPHCHYHLTLDIIGDSITTFQSSYQMVSVVQDALIGELNQMQLQRTILMLWFLALEDAYKAGILHCDFSPGNIIISNDGTGLLIDWDLSKPVSSASETPRCATQTVCLLFYHMLQRKLKFL
jgi:hypothetical protein